MRSTTITKISSGIRHVLFDPPDQFLTYSLLNLVFLLEDLLQPSYLATELSETLCLGFRDGWLTSFLKATDIPPTPGGYET